MMRKRGQYVGAAAAALLGALSFGTALERTVFVQAARGTAPQTKPAAPQTGTAAPKPAGAAAGSTAVPVYRVQPFWPQPLQDHWVLGAISGVTVDAKDTVWV